MKAKITVNDNWSKNPHTHLMVCGKCGTYIKSHDLWFIVKGKTLCKDCTLKLEKKYKGGEINEN